MTAPVVVFDLDGTLTLRDTSVPFLRFVAGKRAARAGVLSAAAWAVPDLAVSLWAEWLGSPPKLGGFSGRWAGLLHQRVSVRTLRGRSRVELETAGADFASRTLRENLRPDARARIEEHRGRAHRLVLASASLDLYLEPLRGLLGFDVVIGTRLEWNDGVATGRVHGLPCWGAEKLRRVREALRPGEEIVHAYGDSRGDRALLAAAKHATWVR